MVHAPHTPSTCGLFAILETIYDKLLPCYTLDTSLYLPSPDKKAAPTSGCRCYSLKPKPLAYGARPHHLHSDSPRFSAELVGDDIGGPLRQATVVQAVCRAQAEVAYIDPCEFRSAQREDCLSRGRYMPPPPPPTPPRAPAARLSRYSPKSAFSAVMGRLRT